MYYHFVLDVKKKNLFFLTLQMYNELLVATSIYYHLLMKSYRLCGKSDNSKV